MLQMYKVFMNDKPIIITDSSKKSNNYEVYNFDEINFEVLQIKINSPLINGVYLLSNHIREDWESFKSNFRVVEAAGGMVKNNKHETLFIYRFGKWDLPKGHIECNESKEFAAVREVQEECGVSGLKLIEEIETTYHIFIYNDVLRLKVTYWFLMRTDFTGILVPQMEEGISEVVFKNVLETNKALLNTYENIKLLF